MEAIIVISSLKSFNLDDSDPWETDRNCASVTSKEKRSNAAAILLTFQLLTQLCDYVLLCYSKLLSALR